MLRLLPCFLVAATIVVGAGIADAQETPNFVGEVLERGTREPLVAVRVLVFQGSGDDAVGYETFTDEEGRFGFIALAPGAWSVLVEPRGYFPLRTSETIESGRRLEVIYRLERGAYNDLDVIIEGDRGRSRATRRQVSIDEVATMPGVYGDPLKVLTTLPGVAKTSAFTSEVVVRGGAPRDTRYSAFGLRVPAAFHFGGVRGIFPQGMVDRLVLHPGVLSVRYGRSTGAVVDIVLPSRVGERTHGHVDLSLLDSTLYLEQPVGGGAWVSVSARRSYYDAIIGGVSIIGGETVILPRYWDVHAQAGWRGGGHAVRVFVFSADDDLVAYTPGEDSAVDDKDLPEASMVQSGVHHQWELGSDTTLSTSAVAGWDRVFDIGTLSGLVYVPPGLSGAQTETRTRRVAARSELASDWTVAQLKVGVEASWSDVDLHIEPDPFNESLDENGVPIGLPAELRPDASISFVEVGAYGELALRWRDSPFRIVPGARVDHFSQIDQTVVDPRIRASLALSPETTLKAGLGVAHQPPRPVEVRLNAPGVDLVPERAVHVTGGVSLNPMRAMELDVEGFHKHLGDVVEFEVDRWRNTGRGRVFGVEFWLRVPLTQKVNGWFAYTLSRAERWDRDRRVYDLYAYDQTHNLSVFGAYRLPRNWSVSARFQYATGFPTYEDQGLGRSVGRTEAFHQLDLRVDKTWVYETWTLVGYFDIQNVYNRFNLNVVDIEGDSEAESLAIPPGVPILPILGVKGEF